MLNNISSNTPKREKKAVGIVTFLMAGAIIGGLIAGNVASAKATNTVDEAKEDMAAIYEMENENPAATFIPEDISEKEVLEVELTNLEANAENDGREKSDLIEEAEAISKLNQTDNKDWDGKVEIWVDGQGWVDADTLSAEEIERLTNPTGNTTENIPTANTTLNVTLQKSGHYEEVWVEDIPGYYDDELKNVAYYVCNGCETVLGTTEADMRAHCAPAMDEGRLECGSWRVDYKLEPTGNKVYVEPQGHYKKVWIED